MRELVGKSKGFFAFVREKGRLWLLVGGALLGVLLLLFGGAHADEGIVAHSAAMHDRSVTHGAIFAQDGLLV